jgi:cobalamin biosynthesis Mg chelatase CobN
MARNSALRKAGSPQRDPVGWSPENEFFEFETKESTRLNAPREDDPQYKNYKAKFVFQEGGRHCKATPRDKLRENFEMCAGIAHDYLGDAFERKPRAELHVLSEYYTKLIAVQTATQNFELDERLQTGIDTLLPKVHKILQRAFEKEKRRTTKKEKVEIEAETKTAEVLAAERLAKMVEDERVARNKAEVLAAEVLAEKKAEETQTEAKEPTKKKAKKAKKEPEKKVETTETKQTDTHTDTHTDNGTDSVTDLITDNGASSSGGSSTDRPKKAPKAPLPPGSAGFWPF